MALMLGLLAGAAGLPLAFAAEGLLAVTAGLLAAGAGLSATDGFSAAGFGLLAVTAGLSLMVGFSLTLLDLGMGYSVAEVRGPMSKGS